MLNRYPLWKYLLLLGLIIFGIIYAAPTFFGDDPAVQISPKNSTNIEAAITDQTKQTLAGLNIPYLSIQQEEKGSLVVRFRNTDDELKARDILKSALGDNYIVALNLAPRTPAWLKSLGAQPVKRGLDLRGGVNFLFDVDTTSVVKARQEGDVHNMGAELRQNNIRYSSILPQSDKLILQFREGESRDKASSFLSSHFSDYHFVESNANQQFTITATITPKAIENIVNYAMEQNMIILTNRVNELGVSEAVVQRQGQRQISVELPGIQDTAQAKDLIGKTATLRFQLVDVENNAQSALSGMVPFGSRLYQFEGAPVLLKNQVILTGNAITYATSMMGENGRPAVSIRLGGGNVSLFTRTTAENIGKPLAVVYVETIPATQVIDGKAIIAHKQSEKIINIATIQSALGNVFEITGLSDMKYAQNLALLLRSGALVAPLTLIQERTVGPSLGEANIHKGITSIIVGAFLVIVFMACYYRVFGLVANLAVLLNIIFILSILSLLGGTLTLPGIAGIVLTVGVAVDANVLINERIREEMRNGMSPQASIHTGYERAFSTIVDANVTTLIVTLILFALGSGAVKSFAITLTIGVLTSMVTAIFFTRAIINLIYGGRPVKSLSIGIKVKEKSSAKQTG